MQKKVFSIRNSLFLSTFIITLFCGCSKRETIAIQDSVSKQMLEKQFYNLENVTDQTVIKIANDFKKIEHKSNFLRDFIRLNGLPDWNKAISFRNSNNFFKNVVETNASNIINSTNYDDKSIYFIPTKNQTSNKVQSYIAVKQHNDSTFSYQLFNKETLENLTPKNKIQESEIIACLSLFGLFEKSINNSDSVKIGGRYNGSIKSVKVIKNLNANSIQTDDTRNIVNSDCVTFITEEVSYIWGGVMDGGAYREIRVPVVTFIVNIFCSGGGSGSGTGSTSGGYVDPNLFAWWNMGGGSTSSPSSPYDGSFNPWWNNIVGLPVSSVNSVSPQINYLIDKLNLNEEQSNFLINRPVEANELVNLIQNDEDGDAAKSASKLVLSTMMNNNEFKDEDIINEYNTIHNQNITDPIVIDAIIRYFGLKHAALKYENSKLPLSQQKSSIKLLYLTFSDAIHAGLDLLGLIPFGGEVFDVINGLTYTLEGDKTNAILSYASAIPFAGYAATTVKAIKAGAVIIAVVGKTGKLVAKRAKPTVFRLACGAVGTQVGHHIISFHTKIQEHDIMQLAFRAGFDPNNAAVNGKAIEGALNSGNHAVYANKLEKALNDIQNQFPNLEPQAAKQKVIELINQIKSIIDANPGVHVDNLPF